MADHSPPEVELNTWQEIANYLGISVREAQNWEKDHGMPVRRLSGKKPRVFAYRPELDAWKLRSAAARNDPQPPRTAAESDGDASGARIAEPAKRVLFRRSVLAGLVGLGAIATPAAVWVLRRQPGLPARAALEGNTLCAWDTRGRLLWSYEFSEPLRDRSRDPWPLQSSERQIQIVSDGNGGKNVAFAAAFAQKDGGPDRHVLFCFSAAGQLLWEHKPEMALTFGTERFDGPWLMSDMMVPGEGDPRIWLSMMHWRWRPSYLVAIDRRGKAKLEFVSAGQINALLCTESASGRYVLAAGINNEYEAAAVAVLRGGAAPSCSPQTRGSRHECTDGPKGVPDRYFLLPPSEVNRAAGWPYNTAMAIRKGSRSIIVETTEATDERRQPGGVLYRFTEALEPVDVVFDNDYAAWHKRLEQEGHLDHSIQDCPQLKDGVKVRRWDAKSGWATVVVPPATSVRPDTYRG